MTGPLPPVVTLKHWPSGQDTIMAYPKSRRSAVLTGFVADIGRVLKKGSKIRIPDLGILQVRVRPARPARRGRNPATGEAIEIKASKASKQVAFRVAKALKEAVWISYCEVDQSGFRGFSPTISGSGGVVLSGGVLRGAKRKSRFWLASVCCA